MRIMGMKCVRYRSNIWGEFGIVEGGRGGFAVAVDRSNGLMDRRDRGKEEEKQRLFICATREQADARLNFEASKYKRYRYY